MIYALVFLIGATAQFISEPRPKIPFDYEPPRTIRKIRPLMPAGKRVVLYPVDGGK